MKPDYVIYEEFERLIGVNSVTKECSHGQKCSCYDNFRQLLGRYKDEQVNILLTKDGFHVSFGVLGEYPPEPSDIIDVERLLRVIKEGK